MKWEFEGYTVYEDGDVLRFENEKGDILGYVSNLTENNVIAELNKGANPIEEGWEDGVGNTINLDGWGD